MHKVVIALVILAFLALGIFAVNGGDGTGNVVDEPGDVCCTFDLNGEQRTCVAVDNKSCDYCKTVCDAF